MNISKAISEVQYKQCFDFIKKMWLDEFEINLDLNIEKQYKSFLESNIYFIQEDGVIIAIIQLTRTQKGFKLQDGFTTKDDCYFLWRIGVSKKYRKKGYGTKLIKHSLEEIEKTGIKTIYTSSEINNIDYYSRFGFKKINNIERKIGNTIAIYMEKIL